MLTFNYLMWQRDFGTNSYIHSGKTWSSLSMLLHSQLSDLYNDFLRIIVWWFLLGFPAELQRERESKGYSWQYTVWHTQIKSLTFIGNSCNSTINTVRNGYENEWDYLLYNNYKIQPNKKMALSIHKKKNKTRYSK